MSQRDRLLWNHTISARSQESYRILLMLLCPWDRRVLRRKTPRKYIDCEHVRGHFQFEVKLDSHRYSQSACLMTVSLTVGILTARFIGYNNAILSISLEDHQATSWKLVIANTEMHTDSS